MEENHRPHFVIYVSVIPILFTSFQHKQEHNLILFMIIGFVPHYLNWEHLLKQKEYALMVSKCCLVNNLFDHLANRTIPQPCAFHIEGQAWSLNNLN